MSPLDSDIETLEKAVRVFAQMMKRPQRWAAISARSKVNIDRPSAIILQTLMSGERSCHVQDLAAQLGIEPPYITRKTQELEQAGYLRRVSNPEDRRTVDLRVTGRGRSVANRLWKAQRETIAEALKDWKPDERRQFVKSFERFSDDMLTASINEQPPARSRSRDVHV